jgi:hypothetical protein
MHEYRRFYGMFMERRLYGSTAVANSAGILCSGVYLASCHDDPLAHEKLWSEGIGEWEVIKKGNPLETGEKFRRQH